MSRIWTRGGARKRRGTNRSTPRGRARVAVARHGLQGSRGGTAAHLKEAHMATPVRDLRVLVLGASISSASLNNRLAALAAKLVEEKGGKIDVRSMRDFDCPFYDADLEADTGVPLGARAFSERLKAADAL